MGHISQKELQDEDDFGDEVNGQLEKAIKTITAFFDDFEPVSHIRPWEAAQIAALAFEAAEFSVQSDGGEMMRKAVEKRRNELQGFTNAFVCGCPDNVKADMIMQMPITQGDGLPEHPTDKRFALDCAEHLGPDWTQAWYHFAVFMTKVV